MEETKKTKRGRKRKERPISTVNSQSNLFADDEKEVAAMISASGRSRAEVVRDLVSTGIRTRRLRAVGRDEAMTDVIDAQRTVVSGSIGPLVSAIHEQKQFVERGIGQMQQEYASIEDRLKRIETALSFVLRGFDRILQQIVIIRALFWFYIFEFYFTMLHTVGKKVSREDLKKNFDARLADIKIEATKERGFLGEVALEKTAELVGKNLVAEAKNPPPAPPGAHPATTS